MRFQLPFIIAAVLVSSTLFAEDNQDESKVAEKIQLLRGRVTRDETLPGSPVVGVTFCQRGRGTKREFTPIADFSHIGIKLDDRYMPLLKSIKQLKTLTLDDCRISDEILKELGDLKNLQELSLIGTQITGERLKQLKDSLPNTKVYDDDSDESKMISEIQRGHHRHHGNCVRDDNAIGRPVVRISLKSVDLQTRQEFLNKYLSVLKECKSLQALDLTGTPSEGYFSPVGGEVKNGIPDADLKGLNELKTLTTLVLAHRRVRDDGLEEINRIPHLTTLDLSGTLITNKGLEKLNGLTNLTTLIIRNTMITDDGLKVISELTNLNLKTLDVSQTNITDEGLKHLKRLNQLTDLELYYTKITDEGMKSIGDLKNLTRTSFKTG